MLNVNWFQKGFGDLNLGVFFNPPLHYSQTLPLLRCLLNHFIFLTTDCTHVTNKPLFSQTRPGIDCTSGILSSADLLTNNEPGLICLAGSMCSDFFPPGLCHQSQDQVVWCFSEMREIPQEQVFHSSSIPKVYTQLLLDYSFLLLQIEPKEDAVIYSSKPNGDWSTE